MNDFIEILSSGRHFWDEIRKKLLKIALIFISVFVLSFFLSGKIIKIFLNFFDLDRVQIITVSPFQFFDLAVNIALFVSIVLTFPLIVWNIFISKAGADKKRITGVWKNYISVHFTFLCRFCVRFFYNVLRSHYFGSN